MIIRKLTTGLYSIVLALFLENDNTYSQSCESWYASHADARNTDYSPVGGPDQITLSWQIKFAGTINLGPTNNNKGVVYITTSGQGSHLYALDNKTGEILWQSDAVNEFAVASSAVLDCEGRIFVADNEAMHAFDENGRILWETPIEGFPFSAQFTHTGKLLFITCIGRIYVLDRTTGENMLPAYDLIPGRVYSRDMDVRACMKGTHDCPCANTPAIDMKSGRFFFTLWLADSNQASLMAMQYTEDPYPRIISLWINHSLPGGSASSPDLSFDGTRLYVNDNSCQLHALNAYNGHEIWSYNIGYEVGGSQSTSPEGYIIPAGGGNAKTLCIADKGLYPELLWQNENLYNRGVATQASGGLAYVTVKTGDLYNDLVVVDIHTGNELDREILPGKTIFSVGTTVGPDGYIYVPTINGHLYAFRPE